MINENDLVHEAGRCGWDCEHPDHAAPSRPRRPAGYYAWAMMLVRCNNSHHWNYKYYGGRGIKVCERWLKFSSFIKDVGPRPSPLHTLDRIDNNGDYEPGNVRWATQKEQCRNSRANKLITINGETHCMSEWEEIANLTEGIIGRRIKLGWTGEKLLAPSGSVRAVQGEQNGSAKLSASDVAIIRKRLSQGERGRYIARDFQVTETTISYIKRGKTWN